jgi:regulator of sigma E protease
VAVRQNIVRVPVSVGEAMTGGWNITWGMAGNVLQVLGNLFTGEVSVSQLGGPVEIARSSVAAAQSGAENLWGLIAFLSINLAVLNLLPIPLLDGGQVLLQVAEGAWRRPFPPMVKEWYARIGLVAIGGLFLTVTFNDLKRLVMSWFGA